MVEKQYKRAFIAAAVPLVLAGCAAPPYQPPAAGDGQVARLRMVQQDPRDDIVAQRLRGTCPIGPASHAGAPQRESLPELHMGIKHREGRRRLDMPDPPLPPVKYAEVRIPAGQPFHFQYQATRRFREYVYDITATCGQGVSFHPVAGADYEVVMYSPTPRTCQLALYKLERSGPETMRTVVKNASTFKDECSSAPAPAAQ
ncbi:hypothetical protein AAW51_2655 [Caldimonas brevitalea]|uniref:Uncharacterized protein n=2 Tax=Caldimonas brevitalea TaxID=413882 RepID=A0A0G3BPS6_9BURK|nr:hypothetical protein AAW51_2655 [Caldimonas brevitalea]